MVTANMVNEQPGCMLVALRVIHAESEICGDKLDTLNKRLADAEGFSSLDVIRRDGGLGTDFYILARFQNVDALEKWRASPERMQLLKEIEAMAIADISRQQASGSNIWFEPIKSMPSAPQPPRLWKRWLTSMLAVYPALLLLVNLLKPVTSALPEALGLFVVAFVLTGLTTAFIVPWLTRVLQDWLTAR